MESTLAPELRRTAQTWSRSLDRIQSERAEIALVSRARVRFAEWSGYSRAGRPSDGTVSMLWVVASLTQYIVENPTNEDVPEALYILGSAYFHLKDAFAEPLRGDRILRLCYEMYPETIWGQRARIELGRRMKHAI